MYVLLLLCCETLLFWLSSKAFILSHIVPLQWTDHPITEANLALKSEKDRGEKYTKLKGTEDIHSGKYHRIKRPDKYNVLLIIVDDMRPDMDCFGGSQFKVYTPNINRLAKKSLVLRQAYTQYASCGPSRATLLTGRRPDTHRLYKNTEANYSKTNFTNMFAYFKRHGYKTYSIGKTFHSHPKSPRLTATDTWSEPPQLAMGKKGTPYWKEYRDIWKSVSREERKQHPLPDDYTLQATLDRLRQVVDTQHPFFIGTGLVQTHTPVYALESFKRYYPLENVTLPSSIRQIRHLPDLAKLHKHEFLCHVHGRNSNPLAVKRCQERQGAVFRQAYLTGETYVDSLIGKLLKELRVLNLNENTIVVVLSDHSYMLGENSLWQKDILLDAAARVPLLIHIPGQTDQGIVSDRLVELVDVFPTLVQAAGLPAIPMCPRFGSIRTDLCHEGTDFTPLVRNPNLPWKKAAFTQRIHKYGKTSKYTSVMAYSARTEQHRYTEYYIKYSTRQNLVSHIGSVHAKELYDHTTETLETYNRAGNSSYRPVMEELSILIHDGWKAALPLRHATR